MLKDHSCFGRDARVKSGLRARCKECRNSTESKYATTRKAYFKRYYRENDQKLKEDAKDNYNKNKGSYVNRANARRARIKDATPNCIKEGDLRSIECMYKLSKKMSHLFNCDYHVDHIIPLRGRNICGLHVPWNLQVLEAKLNLVKSNGVIS